MNAIPQFRRPLFAQTGGRQYQHAIGCSAEPKLGDHERCLHGFAEADIVREEHSRAEAAHNRERGLELMREQFDPGISRRANSSGR